MRLFYIIALAVGFYMAVVTQFVTYAMPKDGLVALVLSRSPDDWSISLDSALKARLLNYDVKQEAVTALHKRADFRRQIYSQDLWLGLVLIAFSIIGFLREAKINSMRTRIEPGASPSGGASMSEPSLPVGPRS